MVLLFFFSFFFTSIIPITAHFSRTVYTLPTHTQLRLKDLMNRHCAGAVLSPHRRAFVTIETANGLELVQRHTPLISGVHRRQKKPLGFGVVVLFLFSLSSLVFRAWSQRTTSASMCASGHLKHGGWHSFVVMLARYRSDPQMESGASYCLNVSQAEFIPYAGTGLRRKKSITSHPPPMSAFANKRPTFHIPVFFFVHSFFPTGEERLWVDTEMMLLTFQSLFVFQLTRATFSSQAIHTRSRLEVDAGGLWTGF